MGVMNVSDSSLAMRRLMALPSDSMMVMRLQRSSTSSKVVKSSSG